MPANRIVVSPLSFGGTTLNRFGAAAQAVSACAAPMPSSAYFFLPLIVTFCDVVFFTPLAVTVSVSLALILPFAASSFCAALDSLTLTFFVVPFGIEKDAFPSVTLFLAAAFAFFGTTTFEAVLKTIEPTQLPVTNAGHAIGTVIVLLPLALNVTRLRRSPGNACVNGLDPASAVPGGGATVFTPGGAWPGTNSSAPMSGAGPTLRGSPSTSKFPLFALSSPESMVGESIVSWKFPFARSTSAGGIAWLLGPCVSVQPEQLLTLA